METDKSCELACQGDLAKIFKVTVRTILNWTNKGMNIPYQLHINSRLKIYHLKDVYAYIDSFFDQDTNK